MLKRNPCGFIRLSAPAVVLAIAVAALSVGDPCADCAAFPAAYAQSAITITAGSATSTVQAAFNDVTAGGTVTFSSGTHANLSHSIISKPMTVTGEAGAVITGESWFQIRGDDVTMQNLVFRDIAPLSYGPSVIEIGWGDRTNVTVSNNTFSNTGNHGLGLNTATPWPHTPPQNPQAAFTNLRVSDNLFRDIGMLHPAGSTVDQQSSRLYTAIRLSETGLYKDLFISNNTIDTVTFAGINLAKAGLVNAHVNGNTISNVLAFGVQKATEQTFDDVGKLAGADSSLSIYDNTFVSNNNALRYLNGTPETVPEAAVVIWGGDGSNVRIYDNVVRDSHNGILLCAGSVCGVHQDNLGEQLDIFRVVDTPIDQFLTVFRNSFIENTGYDLVNLSAAPVFAPFNYWDRGPAERISGSASYSPYYTDAARTATAQISPQQAGIALSQSDCAVSIGDTVSFDLVTGGESPAVSQTVTNAGSPTVESVRLRVDAWTDSGDNEYRTLATFVKAGGEFVELAPGQFVTVGSDLAPSGNFELEFKVVHSGRVLPTGDGALSQAMTFFASCG